jgi:hypothetical protein
MCGRYTLTTPDDIAARFGLGALSETGDDIHPRFNVAPTQKVPVVRTHDGATGLEMMTWGFKPAWMKGTRPPPITARGETLMERPMFKGVLPVCITLSVNPPLGTREFWVFGLFDPGGIRASHLTPSPSGWGRLG